VSGSGINWATCKSAPSSRQITTPAPYHSVFTGRVPFLPPNRVKALKALRCSHGHRIHRQDKTMSVDGLRCILYARIYILYIPYMRAYHRHGIYGVTVTSQSLRPRYDRHRILGSVGLVESTPQPASRSVRTFLHGSGFVQQTQRQTHTQAHIHHATSVTTGRVLCYA